VLVGHVPVHLYGRGLNNMMPFLRDDLGLSNTQVGLLQTMRRAAGGVASIGGGAVTDRYQRLRGHFLGGSLVLMALGFLAAAFTPNYALLLIAVGLGSAMGSFWHPPAASVLSQQFPERRGSVISLHRSSGTVGDTVAPYIVGGLLGFVTWRFVLQSATVLTLVVAVPVWAYLASVWASRGKGPGARGQASGSQARGFLAQFTDLGRLFKQPALVFLLLIAGFRGVGDGALETFFPFYLTDPLGMGPLMMSLHYSLLTLPAIVTGPLVGRLSDRIGRRAVILNVMVVSAVLMALFLIVERGPALLVLAALTGTVMFTINAITQAGAMDVADGLRLEGSIMGLYWGLNAIFGAISPIILGTILDATNDNYRIIFWYALAAYAIGAALAAALPSIGRGPGRRRGGGGG
jgi:MFS family permease